MTAAKAGTAAEPDPAAAEGCEPETEEEKAPRFYVLSKKFSAKKFLRLVNGH